MSLVKIRFTKDAEEVFARDDGRRRTVKIPRGTIREVKPSSARYWIRSMGVAEYVRDGSAPASRAPVLDPFKGNSDLPSILDDLIEIRTGLVKQDIVPVYETFKRLNIDEVEEIEGLTGDSKTVLREAYNEVAKTGSIDMIAVGDLVDAVNEAITAMGTPAASAAVPALPGMPAAGTPRRGPGRPKTAAK